MDFAGKTAGAAMGAPIPSISGGKVVQVFKNHAEAGNGVVIQGEDGRQYRYIHMKNTPALKVGQKVSSGQNLGQIGSTGQSSGPHLDLKIMENGKWIDPAKFLQGMKGSKKMPNEGKLKDLYEQGVKGQPSVNAWKTKSEALKSPGYQGYKKNLVAAVNSGQVPASWAVSLTELIGRESNWNAQVGNSKSSAFGYGQFLKQTRADYKKKFPNLDYNNPVHQIILTAAYVKDRYGSPEKALAYWDKNKSY